MTYIVTYIEVQPGSTSEAGTQITRHAKTSSGEDGNSGIDVLEEIRRQNRFVIIETWKDEVSFRAHEAAEQTFQFRSRLRNLHNCPADQRVHQGFAVGSRRPAAQPGTLCVVTHVDVPPPRKDETEVLLRRLAEQSRNDGGNLRYDVFQQNPPRTNHFTVFAVWDDEKAFISHQTKPHTRLFREALAPMLGAPYDERLYEYVTSTGSIE